MLKNISTPALTWLTIFSFFVCGIIFGSKLNCNKSALERELNIQKKAQQKTIDSLSNYLRILDDSLQVLANEAEKLQEDRLMLDQEIRFLENNLVVEKRKYEQVATLYLRLPADSVKRLFAERFR